MLQKIFDSVFGNYNSKQLGKIKKIVEKINEQEKKFQNLSDQELQKQFINWKNLFTKEPDKLDKHAVEIFAAIKNVGKRLWDKYAEIWIPHDVQLIGGLVLHEGKIAEMKTGEGKTFVCTFPVILNALTGKGVHVITVNDYLAQRDAEWMKPFYEFCGLTVGVVVHGKSTQERQEAYNADITYGTNNEFGFDYLRDNMAQDIKQVVQRPLNYAIVDEVDSILIDEARTPLIISAPAEESTEKYFKYSILIKNLVENEDYNIDFKHKQATLSEKGVKKIEELLGVENIFTEAGFDEVHHIENALKAEVIMKIDQDYVVRDDKIIIVDEFTGRLMPGRRFSDGLHQALEAKESCEIQRESKTLATITFQNYFRLYQKLAGMTGTAETEAEEFAKIYSLDTIVIPTNKPMIRQDLSDKIFKNEKGKFKHLITEIDKLYQKGQPVLIGTINIDKSELLSQLLKQKNIPHEVLNAKHHEREAEIVAKAGQKKSVTIATNMAGRGTDIKLGTEVNDLGGLAILGTERHESRRIDNQLRGRSGRQGDPGFSQFYVSMSDDLMKRFGGDRMASIMDRLGLPEDEPIENKMISKSVENAQKKIEGFHFDSRKHVVQYDDVMNVHREKIYSRRKNILSAENVNENIFSMIQKVVENIVHINAPGPQFNSKWDMDEIWETIKSIKFSDKFLSKEEFQKILSQKEMIEYLVDYLKSSWEQKISNVKKPESEETQEDVEIENNMARQIILHSIDELWLEHINSMTHLRDRVALSGYAQKDPIMEYKKEAFEMFRRLLFDIRLMSIQNLFRINFTENVSFAANNYSDAITNEDQINATLENTGEFDVKPESYQKKQQFKNVGRNDPCTCGSGKKFKKCCGKNL